MNHTPDFLKAPIPARKQFVQIIKKDYEKIYALLPSYMWQAIQLVIFIISVFVGLELAITTWSC